MKHVLIIGAGPAGLTAAYYLSKHGHLVTVVEADPQQVGGISKTIHYRGYSFDLGGHRFYTKSPDVLEFWDELLGDQLLTCSRSSRIFYKGQFFSYPLRVFETLLKVSFKESWGFLTSFLYSKFFRKKEIHNFEEWVTYHFGDALYRAFFKEYSEKVWGMDCKSISRDWADQRINSLSLGKVIYNALFQQKKHKSLITSFKYPRKGPGMMWDKCAEKVVENGGKIVMGSRVCKIEQGDDGRWQLEIESGQRFEGDMLINSASIRDFIRCLGEQVSEATKRAASKLQYRDFITVAVILKDQQKIKDNWLYIHDKGLKVGRIQNYKAWSQEMVPDPSMACYGLEYFCNQSDELWGMSDEQLSQLAIDELLMLHLIGDRSEVEDSRVIRVPKAYPIYDHTYQQNLSLIKQELDHKFKGLYLVGRNGMHRYNNQDHSCMTSILAVKNIISGKNRFDPWRVNQDAIYLET